MISRFKPHIQKLVRNQVANFSFSKVGSIRVASEGPEGALARVAIYIDGGSRYESYENLGITHFVRQLGFSRNETYSALRVQNELNSIGSDLSLSHDREKIVFSATCQSGSVARTTEILSTLLRPHIAEYELEDLANGVVGRETTRAHSCISTRALDSIHAEAYRNSGLGNDVHCPEFRLHSFNPAQLQAHVEKIYNPANIVVVGVGIKHDALVAAVEKSFKNDLDSISSSSSQSLVRKESRYFGGERREVAESTCVAIAFEAPALGSSDSVIVGVLQTILGAGGRKTWSAGARAGTGATSKLQQELILKNDNFISAKAFNFAYRDSGLVGAIVKTNSNASEAASALYSQLESLSNVSDDQVKRASASFLRSEQDRLSTTNGLLNFVGENTLFFSKSISVSSYLTSISNIRPDDVRRVAKSITASSPTVVAFGDVSGLPKWK